QDLEPRLGADAGEGEDQPGHGDQQDQQQEAAQQADSRRFARSRMERNGVEGGSLIHGGGILSGGSSMNGRTWALLAARLAVAGLLLAASPALAPHLAPFLERLEALGPWAPAAFVCGYAIATV